MFDYSANRQFKATERSTWPKVRDMICSEIARNSERSAKLSGLDSESYLRQIIAYIAGHSVNCVDRLLRNRPVEHDQALTLLPCVVAEQRYIRRGREITVYCFDTSTSPRRQE